MIFIKSIILMLVFGITLFLGLAMANKYKYRVQDLKTIRAILNIIETKIKYTYQPLPQIFEDISNQFSGSIGEIFKTAKDKMKQLSAGDAWCYAIDNSTTSMNEEDLSVLKNFEAMLGKTDAEGQLSEIDLIKSFIEIQIHKAEEEQRKNEKLYKNLGIYVRTCNSHITVLEIRDWMLEIRI